MDKNTAFDIINRYMDVFSLNSEFSVALDIALETLSPELELKNMLKKNMSVLCLGAKNTTFYIEVSDDYAKLCAHIEEWRKKIVERCEDETSGFKCKFKRRHMKRYNITADKDNQYLLTFFFEGEEYSFCIYHPRPYTSDFEMYVERDKDAVRDMMSYLNL